MKKIIATALIGMGALSVGMVDAADGTITINGLVSTQACDISINGNGADASLTLDTVQATSLTTSGDVAGAKGLEFVLTNCGDHIAVRAFFEKNNVDTTTGNLKNTAVATSGGAQNVQVQILNDLGQVIDLNSQNNNAALLITNGNAKLPYQAQYFATARSVGGIVATQLVYTLQYL